MNWLKYKLRFWRCKKNFLQTVFCTEFCKLCTFFWYQFKSQEKLSNPLIFKTNTFFQIWQPHLRSINLKLVYNWKPFCGNSSKKTMFNLMHMHHQNLSLKLLWKKNPFLSNASSAAPTDVTFSSVIYGNICLYLQ